MARKRQEEELSVKARMQAENLKKQEESVRKQEAMRKGNICHIQFQLFGYTAFANYCRPVFDSGKVSVMFEISYGFLRYHHLRSS